MLDYIKKAIEVLPADCGNTFIVATLLGLRADEVCKAVTLLKQDTKDYHDKELGILEHYRFKDLFIRRTKKACISIVDDELLSMAKQSCDSREAINSRLKRMKLPMNLKYCRKVFGTWLRQHGIESEFIDVLQGRVPATVFAKHYYRPDPATIDKVRLLLKELKATLVEASVNKELKVND